MRPLHRIALLALLVAVAPVIAGCENFDPDKLDVFDLNKEKPLPGERKPLFPNGVPGVSQGIPQEYMKGNQPQTDMALTTQPAPTAANSAAASATAQQTATAAPVEEVKPAPKAVSKPKRKASRPKQTVKREAKPASKAETKTDTSTQRAQAPANETTQQATSPWPSTPAAPTGTATPWPTTPPTGAAAPWPTAPPPGTFSK